jgi:hypothetical protein
VLKNKRGVAIRAVAFQKADPVSKILQGVAWFFQTSFVN